MMNGVATMRRAEARAPFAATAGCVLEQPERKLVAADDLRFVVEREHFRFVHSILCRLTEQSEAGRPLAI